MNKILKYVLTVIAGSAIGLTILFFLRGDFSKEKQAAVVGFYNVENLFDTVHDEGKNDYEFLPDGKNKWTAENYGVKLGNIASVVAKMAEANGGEFHSILGLAEVENGRVLEDLVNRQEIAAADYDFVHYEGPDGRGIDVAMLYRPDRFKVADSYAVPFDFNSDIEFEYSEEEQQDFRTRDVLVVRGELDGEMFAVMVAHLPSRRGDKGGDLRGRGAEIMYDEAMELMEEYPGIKIVVMGDMNDDPADESMEEYLHSDNDIDDVEQHEFFSPFMDIHEDGLGTLQYRGAWNLFDNILVNYSVVKGEGLQIQPNGKYFGYIFDDPMLIQQEGKFAGSPFRTFSYGEFIGGYSDHLPTYIVLSK